MPYANQLGNKFNKLQEKVDIHDKRISEFTEQDISKILAVSENLDIEPVDLLTELTKLGVAKIKSNTKAGWDSKPALISNSDTLYIYTDYQTQTDSEGNITYIPGIKIGDGLAYLIDLPFIDSKLIDHINNTTIHVTAEEKNFWNNKNRVFISSQDEENLIFTIQ